MCLHILGSHLQVCVWVLHACRAGKELAQVTLSRSFPSPCLPFSGKPTLSGAGEWVGVGG